MLKPLPGKKNFPEKILFAGSHTLYARKNVTPLIWRVSPLSGKGFCLPDFISYMAEKVMPNTRLAPYPVEVSVCGVSYLWCQKRVTRCRCRHPTRNPFRDEPKSMGYPGRVLEIFAGWKTSYKIISAPFLPLEKLPTPSFLTSYTESSLKLRLTISYDFCMFHTTEITNNYPRPAECCNLRFEP